MAGFIPRARVSLTCVLLASGGALVALTNAVAALADHNVPVTETNTELFSPAHYGTHSIKFEDANITPGLDTITTGTHQIFAKALTDHEYNSGEWHIIITNVTDAQSPSSVLVNWGPSVPTEAVALGATPGSTAHYTTTSHLNLAIVSISTFIFDGWDGQFNLSHGPYPPPPTTTTEPATTTTELVTTTSTTSTTTSTTTTVEPTTTTVEPTTTTVEPTTTTVTIPQVTTTMPSDTTTPPTTAGPTTTEVTTSEPTTTLVGGDSGSVPTTTIVGGDSGTVPTTSMPPTTQVPANELPATGSSTGEIIMLGVAAAAAGLSVVVSTGKPRKR